MEKPKRKLTKYNKCMSRELKGNMSGKTKAQRAALFRAAAKRCSRGTSKKASKPSKPKNRASTSRSNPTGGTRKMGKSVFNTQKIFGLLRKGALILPALEIATAPGVTTTNKILRAKEAYFGVSPDGVFRLENLRKGWEPYFWANVVTHGIPKVVSLIKGLF